MSINNIFTGNLTLLVTGVTQLRRISVLTRNRRAASRLSAFAGQSVASVVDGRLFRVRMIETQLIQIVLRHFGSRSHPLQIVQTGRPKR